MKKNLLRGLALVAMLFGAMTMSAKQYCHEELTNGDNKIYLTAQKLSDGNYQIRRLVLQRERRGRLSAER